MNGFNIGVGVGLKYSAPIGKFKGSFPPAPIKYFTLGVSRLDIDKLK